MVDPIPTTKGDHKRISDELDSAYVEAIKAATYAQCFLTHRRGNANEVYGAFYDPFVSLFMHTRSTREMIKDDKNKALISSIERWMQKSSRHHNVRALIYEGLSLFRLYQKAVITSGAVIIRKE